MKIEIQSFDNEKIFRIFVKDNNKFLKNDKSKIYPQYFNEEDVLKIIGENAFKKFQNEEKCSFTVGKIYLALFDQTYMEQRFLEKNWFLKEM